MKDLDDFVKEWEQKLDTVLAELRAKIAEKPAADAETLKEE